MRPFDPYAPPTEPAEPSYGQADAADIYVDTVPPRPVRIAGMAAILTGVVMLFTCLRMLLATRGTGALVVEGSLAAAGATYFGAAWGAASGRLWMVVAGMLVSPFAGLASLVVLLTGAVAGAMAAVAALVTLVLLAVNYGAVRRMARARVAMTRFDAVPALPPPRVTDAGPLE